MAPHHIPSPIIEISVSAASGSVSPNCYSDPRLNLENWIYDGHRSRVVLSGVARSWSLHPPELRPIKKYYISKLVLNLMLMA